MHQLRTPLLLLFSLLLVLVSVPTQAASQFEPRLQAALSAAAPSETIPVIIRFTEQINLDAYRHLPKKERRRQLVQELRANSSRSQKGLRKLLQQAGVGKIKDLWHINALAIDADPALIAAIASRPEVASVSLDGLVALPPAQPAAVATTEWNLASIGVLDLRAQLPGLTGTGITVATIDTGVDGSHPNLQNWRGGFYDWFDIDQVAPAVSPDDQDGHGTAVMGIIAGNSVGGDAIGVAPGAEWLAANPFAAGNASYADLHSSFAWALDPNGPDILDDIAPDVVNNSWALDAPGLCLFEFQVDINRLNDAGIGVVFAAGNSGPNLSTSQSPANNANTVAIGATDASGKIAWFSSRGPSACGGLFPQLVAPGVGIWTTFSGGGYGFADGTSFSAPHVAGVMALLMQAYPFATVAEIESAMTASADDLGPVGPDSAYGYGLLQAMNAWRYLAAQPILSIHDPSAPENDHHLDFGNVTPETSQVRSLTLRNAGSTDLSISAIDFTGLPPEITVDADSCSPSTLVPSADCSISLRFSPPDFSLYTGSLIIPSDDLFNPSMTVTLAGTGNTPPPAATLLSPAAGAINVARPVTFSWAQSADVDGDTISTALLIALENPDFSQSTPIVPASVATAGSFVLLAGFGLFSVSMLLHRRPLRLLFATLTTVLLLSCGGGGGSPGIAGEVISSNPLTLTPNATYYWKVQSTDATGAVTESVVRKFTTAP